MRTSEKRCVHVATVPPRRHEVQCVSPRQRPSASLALQITTFCVIQSFRRRTQHISKWSRRSFDGPGAEGEGRESSSISPTRSSIRCRTPPSGSPTATRGVRDARGPELLDSGFLSLPLARSLRAALAERLLRIVAAPHGGPPDATTVGRPTQFDFDARRALASLRRRSSISAFLDALHHAPLYSSK